MFVYLLDSGQDDPALCNPVPVAPRFRNGGNSPLIRWEEAQRGGRAQTGPLSLTHMPWLLRAFEVFQHVG
jgi:hypothetical protein